MIYGHTVFISREAVKAWIMVNNLEMMLTCEIRITALY